MLSKFLKITLPKYYFLLDQTGSFIFYQKKIKVSLLSAIRFQKLEDLYFQGVLRIKTPRLFLQMNF